MMQKRKLMFWAVIVIFTIVGTVLFYGVYLHRCNEAYISTECSYSKYAKGSDERDLMNDSLYDTFEESAAAVGITPDKVWDYGDKVYLLACDYSARTVVVYRVYKDADKYTAPEQYFDISAPSSIWGVYDRHCIDEDYAHSMMCRFFQLRDYIDGGGQYNDVYLEVYRGEDIKDLKIGTGDFRYEKLWDYPKTGEDCYLCIYELKDARTILEKSCSLVENDGRDEYSTRVKYRAADVMKALKIKARLRFQFRIVIYLAVLCALLVATVLFLIKSYRLSTVTTGKNTRRTVLTVVTGVMCCISVFMVLYFIYNPELTFGLDGITGGIQKLFGFRISDVHYRYD